MIDLPDGGRLRFYPSSISAALWMSAADRNEDAEFLQLALRQGDTYIDCGANIGHLAVVARRIVGATGSVVAIEANPKVYGYCLGNLRLNGFDDVRAINVALGDKSGRVAISDRRDDDQNRIGEGATTVPMRPLDDLVEAPRIDLLKLDVEGYELNVLHGALRTLSNTSIVYCELSSSNCRRYGYEPGEVERVLAGSGFVFLHREGRRWLTFTDSVFSRLKPEQLPATGYNLVAVKRDALVSVGHRLAEGGHTLDDRGCP
jgi:FkbM family methyltransferase